MKCSNCENEAEPQIKLCFVCKEKHKVNSKKCRNLKKLKGECSSCNQRALPGLSRCQNCFDKLQTYKKDYSDITQDFIKQCLNYDKNEGIFKWKVKVKGYKVGDVAGRINSGYLIITLKGVNCLAHRIAWLYEHGNWPVNLIDHIDGNKLNNKISNLREATYITNGQNMKKAMSNNELGILGVCKIGDFYLASIKVNKKLIKIGYYDSKEEAQQAYLQTKRELHPYNTL